MKEENQNPVPTNYFLRPGFIYVAVKATTISTVLGSCVSVCMYDRKKKTCGMNHFLLPHTREKSKATARYGNVAIGAMLNMMLENGSKLKHIEAQIFGGAHNPLVSPEDIGSKNISVARKMLQKRKIRLVSEDVGGEKGRKVVFNTETNELAVIKVDNLRRGDWYPYEQDR